MDELKHYLRLLTRGRIGRREFMGRAVALGATTALASSLAGRGLRAATPKKGGHFRLGLGHGSTTDSLDPATYENGFMANLDYSIANSLTEVMPDGQLGPELAESWEASADAATWTFKLRSGVEFHNGKTMTADDVIASINHHRGADTKSAAKPIVDPIEEIKKDDDQTIVFALKGGNADFPFIMSDYHLVVKPSDGAGGIDWQSGVSTGPFALESFEPGVRADFKRNANYWKDGAGHFDSVEMLSIIDVAARTNALTTGELDAMDRADLKTVHLLKRNKDIRIQETTGTLHYTVPMRTDTAPFDDNDVRMALKHAIDREAIVKTVLKGHGVVGNDHPISTSNRYHASELEQRPYDPDKAKFYLKQAGLTEITVPLHAADAAFGGAVDAAVLYKEHARAAGITIEVVREPNDGYWSNVWMNKPWCMCYWGGRPTEDWMFSTAYAEGADWNDTFWSHETFNKLLVDARAELDEAKRREMYVEMQTIVANEGGVVVPMFANNMDVLSNAVATPEVIASNWGLDGSRCTERWWFA